MPRSEPSQPDPDRPKSTPSRRRPFLPGRAKVCVVGLGQMGLVCAACLATPGDETPDPSSTSRAGRPVNISAWGRADEAGMLVQTRKSPRLPGFILPEGVQVCLRASDALRGCDLIVSAVPVQAMRTVWTRLARHVPPEAGVLSVAKGIETSTLLRPTQIIADVLRRTGVDDPDRPPRPMACLSGPTIATELARCMPAAMIAASDDAALARRTQALFTTHWLRVYTNADLLGVELAGAMKNVIAIAAGIVDGLRAGNNAKSALLARGLAEITRLGVTLGAAPDTFFGIAGVGDLATTCFSPEGRNRSCGEAIGKGANLDQYLKKTKSVVEGVATTKAVLSLARKYKVEMPITAAVHAVLFEHVDPVQAIGSLMTRAVKAEKLA